MTSAARITLVRGDITTLEVDAIVNAANSSLLGGGGVDGAIHRAAGPRLLEECRTLGGCPPGEARVTQGYELPARWVIHTVGPIWQGGEAGGDQTLASAYRSSLALAAEVGARTVAFPSISTGVYGFPIPRAAPIAVAVVLDDLPSHVDIDKVTFVCFDEANYLAYEKLLADVNQNATHEWHRFLVDVELLPRSEGGLAEMRVERGNRSLLFTFPTGGQRTVQLGGIFERVEGDGSAGGSFTAEISLRGHSAPFVAPVGTEFELWHGRTVGRGVVAGVMPRAADG